MPEVATESASSPAPEATVGAVPVAAPAATALQVTTGPQSPAPPGAVAEQAASNGTDDPSETVRFPVPPDLEDLEDTQELPIVRADPPPPVAAGPDIVG